MIRYMNSTLSRSPVAITVLDRMRNDIVCQKLPAGQKLTEQTICDAHGVSRSTTRQIFQQLENEGLIVMLENGTKAVKGFTEKDLNDLYRLRNDYEMTAVRSIFASWTRPYQQGAGLLSKLQDLSGRSREDIIALDVEFHRSIVEMSENTFVLKGYEAIAPLLHTLFCISINLYEEQFFHEFPERHSLLLQSLLFDTEEDCVRKFEEHHANAGKRAHDALREIWKKED